jgi:hypothetical protein
MSDGDTWYPEACDSIGLELPGTKSFSERIVEYLKDRTQDFYDYYSCIKIECQLVVLMYNVVRVHIQSIC